MVEPTFYLNGALVPASQAKINIYDHGFLLGASMTDMARTFGHHPFRLKEHISRLYRSCKYANFCVPISEDEMLENTEQLVDTNCKLIGPEDDLCINYMVTPGENSIYSPTGGAVRTGPTVCVHTFPLPLHAWRHYFSCGAHAVTPSIRHIPPQCLDPKAKYRSRLHMWLADQQTQAVDPKGISLMLDVDGHLSECVGANFVVVQDRTV